MTLSATPCFPNRSSSFGCSSIVGVPHGGCSRCLRFSAKRRILRAPYTALAFVNARSGVGTPDAVTTRVFGKGNASSDKRSKRK
eukprot:5632553-Amphidinium_carterae.1